MKLILTILARLSLVLTILPAGLHLSGQLSIEAVHWIMAAAALTWFITAPLLQREHERSQAAS